MPYRPYLLFCKLLITVETSSVVIVPFMILLSKYMSLFIASGSSVSVCFFKIFFNNIFISVSILFACF